MNCIKGVFMTHQLISIIVPIYKAELYLNRCIQSIVTQTYTNIEIILVNDGSPDRCGEICDEWEKKDSRLKIIHKLNGGVSSARNAGLEIMSGDWVCFVDADDYIDVRFVQNFIDMIKPNTEMVLQSFWYHDLRNNTIKDVVLPDMELIGNYKLVQWLEDAKVVHNGFIWHRLFKSEIIKREKICFPGGISFAEDGWFFFKYLSNTHNFIFSSKQGYHYTAGIKDSLTSVAKQRSLEMEERIIRNYTELLKNFYIDDSYKIQHEDFIKKYMWRFICDNLIYRAYIDGFEKSKTINIVNKLIHDYDMDTVIKIPLSIRLIKNLMKKKEGKTKSFLISIFFKYRKIEKKIKRYL